MGAAICRFSDVEPGPRLQSLPPQCGGMGGKVGSETWFLFPPLRNDKEALRGGEVMLQVVTSKWLPSS